MKAALTIIAVDPDDDYLGIEIEAHNERFAGSTRIYAGQRDLSQRADVIAGFPSGQEDHRTCEMGTRDPLCAGGYFSLSLRYVDLAGHVSVEVELEDDDGLYVPASA